MTGPEKNQLVVTTLISMLTFRLNPFRLSTKEQALAKVFAELSSGKVSADMVALAVGNMHNLSVEEIEKIREQCGKVSHVNLEAK